MSLGGKVILITGAGRGIGRAISLRFAEDGGKLALASRTGDEIEVLAREIGATGGTAIAVPTDVTSESDVQNLVEQTESRLGPVDILINNAAILSLCPLKDVSVDEWRSIMDTNLLGPFLCSRAVLPSMMERRSGRIINIGSMAGRRGYPDQGVYCASKHGLVGLTKVLAIETKPYGIRVNMVSPGGVLTDLSKGLRTARGLSNESEWMSPEEVTAGVYYIASQDGAASTDELVLRRFESDPWR